MSALRLSIRHPLVLLVALLLFAATTATVSAAPRLNLTLGTFDAACRASDVLVTWETANETNILGFNLYRIADSGGTLVQLNEDLIPSASPGGGQGAFYEFVDDGVEAGNVYDYYLAGIDMNGNVTRFGPASAAFPCVPTALTLSTLAAAPATPAYALFALLGLAGLGIALLLRRN